MSCTYILSRTESPDTALANFTATSLVDAAVKATHYLMEVWGFDLVTYRFNIPGNSADAVHFEIPFLAVLTEVAALAGLTSEADAWSDYEYEPNREALAMEARALPEGRWGDE